MFYICAVYAPFVDNSAATVLSRLDYRNAVLVGLPAATPARRARLQSVMHETARLVLDLKPRDHITPGLRGLHWVPIMQRIEYKLCLLVHKTLIGQAPDYITNLLTLVTNIPPRSSVWLEEVAVAAGAQ